jgi:primosomal protein N' (replication factor Y)
MIAHIIPILRLPANLGVFDYLVPDELAAKIKKGQIVKVNFWGQKINGLAIKIKAKSAIRKNKLKPVLQIIDESPFLTINQLKLIDWLANHYYVSQALAAKLIIPELPKKEPNQTAQNNKGAQLKIFIPPKKIKKIVNLINQSKKEKFLFWCDQVETKIDFYLGLIKKVKQGQILILFAEQDSLEFMANQLKNYLANFLVISSAFTKKELGQVWWKIKNGDAQIVLGTRLAVFYPYQNLKYLIIDEENNPHYKQWDMNPRYDAKVIVQKIAKQFQAKLIFFSALPTVESFWQSEKNKIKLHKILKLQAKIEIVDLVEQMKGGNFSIISQVLEEEIKRQLKEKRQIALILNRKGYARITLCRDCGFVAECPDCSAALNLSHNRLKCPNCKFQQDNLLFCPRCHNPEIKSVGSGTQKIESEIKKIFPETKIARLDSDNQKNAKVIKKLFQAKKIEILIGTQMILKSWLKNNLGLTAFINIDTDLNQPSYRATENTFQMVAYALTLLNEKAKLIIQTYNFENPIFQLLKSKDWPAFYQKEIEDRQTLFYPPFGALTKLIYQNKNKKRVELETEQLFKKLKNKYPAEQIFISKIKKVRKNYQQFILLKSKNPDLRLAKNDLPTDWLIDLTPQSLG